MFYGIELYGQHLSVISFLFRGFASNLCFILVNCAEMHRKPKCLCYQIQVYLSVSLRYSYDTLAGPKLFSSISNLILLLCSCVDFDSLYIAKAEEEEDKEQWVLRLWTCLQLHLAVRASDFQILIDGTGKLDHERGTHAVRVHIWNHIVSCVFRSNEMYRSACKDEHSDVCTEMIMA